MLDSPVFKKLAHNDTGAAEGNQSGILIPKKLVPFFPRLPEPTPSTEPSVGIRLDANLYVDGVWVERVATRYQYQTRGGSRRPEWRLTDNLGALHNKAAKDDIVLFFRDLSEENRIQVHLVTKGTPEYKRIDRLAGAERWGPLDPLSPPIRLEEITEADGYIEDVVSKPGKIFRTKVEAIEGRTRRLARDRAFRRKLLDEYDNFCCFTGRRFAQPSGAPGLDGAHIIPVERLGSDHPVNGILLSKDIHWAFDHGLIGVGDDRNLIVPDIVAKLPGNSFLSDLAGKPIREATTPGLRASPDALRWHRGNVLLK